MNKTSLDHDTWYFLKNKDVVIVTVARRRVGHYFDLEPWKTSLVKRIYLN